MKVETPNKHQVARRSVSAVQLGVFLCGRAFMCCVRCTFAIFSPAISRLVFSQVALRSTVLQAIVLALWTVGHQAKLLRSEVHPCSYVCGCKSLADGAGGLYHGFGKDVSIDGLGGARVAVAQMLGNNLHRYTHVDQ